jgi:hypothetical protein
MIDVGFVLVELETALDLFFDDVQGGFGTSQLSNFALSASRCGPSS